MNIKGFEPLNVINIGSVILIMQVNDNKLTNIGMSIVYAMH